MTQESDQKALEERQSLLSSAIGKLEIQSVLLTNSQTFVKDGFAMKEEEAGDYVNQSFVRPTQVGVSAAQDEYGFKVAAGIRLLRKDEVEQARHSDTQEFTCVEVRGEFLALYKASEPLTPEEVSIFHQQNAVFNIWPYWREFVQQMGWRVGVPYLQVRLLKQDRVK